MHVQQMIGSHPDVRGNDALIRCIEECAVARGDNTQRERQSLSQQGSWLSPQLEEFHKMAGKTAKRKIRSGAVGARNVTRADLGSEIMGRNSLQGNDQARIHNERQTQAEAKLGADEGVVQTFEKIDGEVRAASDLGKRNRSTKGKVKRSPKRARSKPATLPNRK